MVSAGYYMSENVQKNNDLGLSRRGVLAAGAAGVAVSAIPLAEAQGARPQSATVTSKLSLTVNGKVRNVDVDTRTTLLDLLRENLHLTGTVSGRYARRRQDRHDRGPGYA
jgi:xanthine dehydrogenase YagT iron-sulfur-binding subunit